MVVEREIVEFTQRALLAWFGAAGRKFPWRETDNSFFILLAEKLLQQTAARPVVVAAFEELSGSFPTPQSLSSAGMDTLERIVRPLGFNYRSRELRELASVIVSRHSGQVPALLEELLALPGVGDYMARAVLCVAFNQDISVVDVNVARVYFRFLGILEDLPKNPARKRSLISLAQQFIPAGYAKEFNWALLDLGALICTPRDPKCSNCPLSPKCSFHRANY